MDIGFSNNGLDLTVPEYKKDKSWYATVVREYAQAYNRPFWVNGLALNPISEIKLNRLYYFSTQDNVRNFWAVQDTPLVDVHSKSNELYKLINFLMGKISDFMVKYKTSTDVLSPNAVAMKQELKQMYLFQIENADLIRQLAMLGIEFNALPKGVLLKTKEDVDYYFSMTYKDVGAITAERLSAEIMRTSDYFTLRVQDFWNVLIAGYCSTDLEVINGKLREVAVLPEEVIMDIRNPNDNCYNDAAMYRGRFINLASPYEVLEQYGEYLDDEAKNEIKQLAKSTNTVIGRAFIDNYPASPTGTYDWYSVSQSLGNPITGLSVVKMYFYAAYDYRTKERKGKLVYERDYNEKGEPIPSNQNRMGLHANWRVHQAVLIGGKWICCEGVVENAVYSQTIKGKQLMPQTLYIHDFQGGYYKSLTSRLRDLQDDVNLCDTKIKSAELNDLGVNVVFNAGRAKDLDIKEIYKDFKSIKMTALKVDADDDEYSNNLPLLEMVDYTGSLKVVDIYLKLKEAFKREMSQLCYLPDVAMGMQDVTIGKGVQSASVSLANTGLMTLFNGFASAMQRRIQLSVNTLKVMMLSPYYDEDYARMIVGDVGYNWLKTAIEDDLEYLGIYINPYDVVDEQMRQKIEMRLQAGMQNGLITFRDVVEIDNMDSLREINAYIRYITAKREEEAKAIAEQQRQDNLMLAQQNQQAMIAKAQIPAQAQVEAARERSDASRYQADKSAETKQHDTNTNAGVKLATSGSSEK